MGCGPRYHDDRGQWTTVCQPVGSGEIGDSCSRTEPTSCGEGLYCEAHGGDGQSGAAGRCAPLCMVGTDEFCGDQRWCRPLTGTVDYEVGECRARCEVGPGFDGEQCPEGLGRCKPESRLVPTGGGAGGGLDVAQNPPLCWAAGSRAIGESCNSGDCVPAAECLYGRGERSGYVESLLSPYVGGSGVPICRAICDPFGPASESPCGDGETCLFNYPWNASVGHCATIEADLAPGDACDFAGLACGKDSICVDDGGNEQCQRFCEFRGGDADGYDRSTCPSGFACEPLVADIGVCR